MSGEDGREKYLCIWGSGGIWSLGNVWVNWNTLKDRETETREVQYCNSGKAFPYCLDSYYWTSHPYHLEATINSSPHLQVSLWAQNNTSGILKPFLFLFLSYWAIKEVPLKRYKIWRLQTYCLSKLNPDWLLLWGEPALTHNQVISGLKLAQNKPKRYPTKSKLPVSATQQCFTATLILCTVSSSPFSTATTS